MKWRHNDFPLSLHFVIDILRPLKNVLLFQFEIKSLSSIRVKCSWSRLPGRVGPHGFGPFPTSNARFDNASSCHAKTGQPFQDPTDAFDSSSNRLESRLKCLTRRQTALLFHERKILSIPQRFRLHSRLTRTVAGRNFSPWLDLLKIPLATPRFPHPSLPAWLPCALSATASPRHRGRHSQIPAIMLVGRGHRHLPEPS